MAWHQSGIIPWHTAVITPLAKPFHALLPYIIPSGYLSVKPFSKTVAHIIIHLLLGCPTLLLSLHSLIYFLNQLVFVHSSSIFIPSQNILSYNLIHTFPQTVRIFPFLPLSLFYSKHLHPANIPSPLLLLSTFSSSTPTSYHHTQILACSHMGSNLTHFKFNPFVSTLTLIALSM